MKTRIINTVLALTLVLSISACKKDNNNPVPTANINVINAAVDAGAVKVSATNESFSWGGAPALNYSASTFLGTYPGTSNIKVVSSADTTKRLFSTTAELKTINTLYLTGQSPNVEGLFVAENNVPFGVMGTNLTAETVMYIRFVNLLKNGGPINVKISTAGGNEVVGLAYKSYSDFKKYIANPAVAATPTTPAVPQTPDYTFEFRDAGTNELLASATVGVTNNRYRTLSLVLKGLKGGTGANAQGVLQVNYHYDKP